MTAALLFSGVPIFVWLWRKEIVTLVGDCIAAGIRKSREDAGK